MLKRVSFIAAAGLGAALFSATGFAKEPEGANADPRIGEEVRNICFGQSINGWKGLKGEDDVVLLKRSVSDWYRVELAGACDYRLFRSAMAIGIDSRPAGGCVSRGDVIIVKDTPGFDRRCVITRIQKWDEDAAAAPDDEGDSEMADDES
ncbi:DUF6491 family protein [Hyphococcus sp.]|uniref:DUF6491 family protein n=1 Tax=Hyphococcus sp. TaxID=2038636 RepID=UPI002087ED5F|nr:MAG: hypothetical protein DHS20C04_15830 [Marinicaulis sp.]